MAVDAKRAPLKTTGCGTALVVVSLIVLLPMCGGIPFIIEVPLRLVFGWLAFISRNLTEITVSWPGLLTFAMLLAATLALTKYLGQSLFGNEDRPFPFRSAIAATILVVALFSAGIGATGVAHQTGWLIRSPEPLLDGGGTAALRMSDSNRQKQLGLGFHDFHATYKDDQPFRLATVHNDNGMLLHGWQTQLLPFVEQQALYESINKAESWKSRRNRKPFGTVVHNYLRLDRATETGATHAGSYALSHLAANRLLLGDRQIKQFSDISDGLANTVLLGSAGGDFLPWGHPQGWRSSEFLPNENERGFGSGFNGGCHVTMADGSVIFVTDSIDRRLWDALFTPNGGEPVDEMRND